MSEPLKPVSKTLEFGGVDFGTWYVRVRSDAYIIEKHTPEGVLPDVVAYITVSEDAPPAEWEWHLKAAHLAAAAPDLLRERDELLAIAQKLISALEQQLQRYMQDTKEYDTEDFGTMVKALRVDSWALENTIKSIDLNWKPLTFRETLVLHMPKEPAQ